MEDLGHIQPCHLRLRQGIQEAEDAAGATVTEAINKRERITRGKIIDN